jgi:hypothetical protein
MTGAPSSRIVDLRKVVDDPVVREQLGWARLSPRVDGVDHLIDGYRANQRTRVVLGITRGHELRAVVVARTPHAGVCEVLALSDTDGPAAQGLVEAAADQLNAVAVSAAIRPEDRPWWEGLGFAVRPDAVDGGICWAERHHPPVVDGFHSAPLVRVTSDRRVEIDLPPDGNTLPLVPEALRDGEVPAHVLGWVLDADEVGLLLQDLAPDLFPPVTPAVRPESVRSSMGSLGSVLGDPSLDEAAPTELVPGLPEGLHVPIRIVEMIAAADRVRQWLLEAKRVRTWAEEQGHGEEPWIVHEPWAPHDPTPPELHPRSVATDQQRDEA